MCIIGNSDKLRHLCRYIYIYFFFPSTRHPRPHKAACPHYMMVMMASRSYKLVVWVNKTYSGVPSRYDTEKNAIGIWYDNVEVEPSKNKKRCLKTTRLKSENRKQSRPWGESLDQYWVEDVIKWWCFHEVRSIYYTFLRKWKIYTYIIDSI